jgi:hypothetical protein
MVHLNQGDVVGVKCDGWEIDQAIVDRVDRVGRVVMGADFQSLNSGTFTLNYNPSMSAWVLHLSEGWTGRQPNGAVYQLEVVRGAKREPNLEPAHALVDG